MGPLRTGLGSKERRGSGLGAGETCAGGGAGTLTFRVRGRGVSGPLLSACCTHFYTITTTNAS